MAPNSIDSSRTSGARPLSSPRGGSGAWSTSATITNRILTYGGVVAAGVAAYYYYWYPSHAGRGNDESHADDAVEPVSSAVVLVNEREALRVAFEGAQEFAKSSLKVDTDTQLKLYGLYKVATCGKVDGSTRPGMWDITGRAKWDAWSDWSTRVDSPEKAMAIYVDLVESFKGKDKEIGNSTRSASGDGSLGMGPKVSTLALDGGDSSKWEGGDDLFFLAQSGKVKELEQAITGRNEDLAQTDEDGLTLLHWACDRGHLKMSQVLIRLGAEVDSTDRDGLTPLAYAVTSGHEELAVYLVEEAGADVEITDAEGESVLAMGSDELRRKLLNVRQT